VTVRGGCHCGRIRFEVAGTPDAVSICNCSICKMTGYLHWNVAPSAIELLTRDGDWSSYRFGTQRAEHRFCTTCGISPFRVPRSDPDKIGVNARCLEGIDPDALPIARFDGREWEAAMRAERGPAWKETD
jgi:hypothetical protein